MAIGVRARRPGPSCGMSSGKLSRALFPRIRRASRSYARAASSAVRYVPSQARRPCRGSLISAAHLPDRRYRTPLYFLEHGVAGSVEAGAPENRVRACVRCLVGNYRGGRKIKRSQVGVVWWSLTDRTSRRSKGRLPLAAAGLRRSCGRRLLVVEKLELGLALVVVVEKLELGLELFVVVVVVVVGSGGCIGLPLADGSGPTQGRRPERGGGQRPVHPRWDEFGKDCSPAHIVSIVSPGSWPQTGTTDGWG